LRVVANLDVSGDGWTESKRAQSGNALALDYYFRRC
jgi:hypothetical protein